MKKMIVFTLAALVCCTACFVQAQEPKEGEAKEVKLTKVNYVAATSVDFKKELGVAFPGLQTLGIRIEQAAGKDFDPVSLVAAGLELKAAETAAGKTAANYKADNVIKRGFDLAVERSQTDELKAVKALLPNQAETLDKAIKVAEAAKDESAREHKNYYLYIYNRHGEDLRVTVDGRDKGIIIRANRSRTPQTIRAHIHDCAWVRFYCADDGDLVYETELHVDGGGRESFSITID